MGDKSNNFLRIGVFYDGQYFYNVSNYYAYQHERKARISVSGLHNYIRQKISETLAVVRNLCHIVDAHYFRGRLSAKDANSANKLYQERVFDDILMGENVVSHYMPLRSTISGEKQEKGVDVWLALEAYELAIYKRFDIFTLIAGDGDYVPLIRKLNTLGTKVMLLYWDFEYTDEDGKKRQTRTSQSLLEEVTYPVAMHQIIDDRTKKNDINIYNLFVSKESKQSSIDKNLVSPKISVDSVHVNGDGDIMVSEILSLKEGYEVVSLNWTRRGYFLDT